jgi:hypothetical protein
MLENKKTKIGGEDFMDAGEFILSQLAGQKDVSLKKVEEIIGQLDVQFDPSAVKVINEVCKCNLIEGIDTNNSQILNDQSDVLDEVKTPQAFA